MNRAETQPVTVVGPISLWRQPNFLKLWTSETISSFGAQFTELAIPFTAVLTLRASPTELGFLNAALTAPFLLLSLFAGVWADRHRRRSIMIASNLGRASLLLLIPMAAFTGVLSMTLLFLVAFLVGSLRVFFDIAYQSFLPSIVQREELVDANSRLEASRAVSSVAGPGVAGIVIQLATAPFALAADITSFISSTLFLSRIHQLEEIDETAKRTLTSDIREGLSVVFNDSRLRSLAAAAATANFFEFAIQAIFILYTVDILLLQPELLGIILSVGALGAVAGALVAGKMSNRLGIGPAIIVSLTLGVLIWGPSIYFSTPSTATALLVLGWFFGELSFVSWSINQSSFRQAICPAKIQGRVSATLRFFTAGMVPLGSIAGGLMGEVFGLRVAIAISIVALLAAPVFLVLSPVRDLKRVSDSDILVLSKD